MKLRVKIVKECVQCICALWLFLISTSYATLFAPNPTYHPHYAVHQQLQKFIPIYTDFANNPWPPIYTNKILKLNVTDPAVKELRKRLYKMGDLAEPADIDNPYFDKKLEDAVRLFQERHGILTDGIVGKDTLKALNTSPQKRLKQISFNIKRWEAFSKEIVPKYIWINVPDYRLRFVDNHQTVLTARVIVGKPDRITPEFDSEITHIVLNPSWTVPPGIAKHDLIPKILANPNYLKAHQIRIFSASNPTKELPFNKIQWSSFASNPKAYILRQDPGPNNALGQIKFQFFNPHSIYLHDTPSKELFNEQKRLFSSGCVRLENPLALFSKIAEGDPAIQKQLPLIRQILQSGRTTTLKLAHPIPIRITYITAWVDDLNILHFWNDVYKMDHHLIIKDDNEHNDLPQPL